MAFSHFRRHEKLYLYLAFGAMFFALVVFAVPTALYNLADSGGASIDIAGRFVDSRGQAVEIPVEDYTRSLQMVRRLAQGFMMAYRTEAELQPFEHVIMAHEAKLAGIHISDDQLRQVLGSLFGATTAEDYRRIAAEQFGGAKQLEGYLREVLAIGTLRSMTAQSDVITDKEVYDAFAESNEVVEVAYADFPYADYAGDQASVSDEDLSAYLDEMNESRKSEFSTPEKYGLQVAYLNYRDADIGEFEGLLESITEPEETRISQTFSMNRKRYEEMVRAKRDDDSSGDDSGSDEDEEDTTDDQDPDQSDSGQDGLDEDVSDESGTDDSGAPSEADPSVEEDAEEVTLEQARDFVVKDLQLDALIREFETQYNEYQQSLLPTEESEDDQNLAPPEAVVNTQLDEKFKELAATYHMTVYTTDEPIERSAISELEHGSDESLGFMVPAMKVHDVRSRPLRSGSEEGAVIRLVEKVEAEVKPLDQIRESLTEAFIEEQKRQRAEEAANRLYDKMKELARSNVPDKVEAIEALAREAADKRIADEGIEDEAAKQAIYDEELSKEQASIDALLQPYLGETFESAAEAMNIEIHELPEFRKSFQVSPAYRRLSAGPKKYLAGFSAGVTNLQVGDVSRVSSDNESDACYIAKLVSSRKPEPEEMTPRDRQDSMFRVQRQQASMFNDMMLRQRGMPIPDAARELEVDYQFENLLPSAQENGDE